MTLRNDPLERLTTDHPTTHVGRSRIVLADCFDWLACLPENSLHAVVTDPPYGVKEYDADQIEKLTSGSGGVWRIPPSFDGHTRAPLPRFTALNARERAELQRFFADWSRLVTRALRPGGHVFLAGNAFLSQMVFSALVEGGLEFRGELIRLVQTLRGGDRPKNAEAEFPGISSLPRGGYEPWGVLRRPLLPGMKVSDCLREYETGGLRRLPDGRPFSDVILSERTPQKERAGRASQPQATIPAAPACLRRPAAGRRGRRRPVHGVRVHGRGGGSGRRGLHRRRAPPGVL